MADEKRDFTITGRYIQSFEVVGYFAIDNKNNKERLLKTQDVIKLAKLSKIDAEYIKLDDKEYLYIAPDKKIKDIFESRTKMDIVYRIVDSTDKVTGYSCKDENNRSYKVSPEQLWELAYNGAVNNAKAVICGNDKAILGKEISLIDLPKIENRQ